MSFASGLTHDSPDLKDNVLRLQDRFCLGSESDNDSNQRLNTKRPRSELRGRKRLNFQGAHFLSKQQSDKLGDEPLLD
jgi:hypothetical protein